jgi:hypothetical protein
VAGADGFEWGRALGRGKGTRKEERTWEYSSLREKNVPEREEVIEQAGVGKSTARRRYHGENRWKSLANLYK